MWGPAGDWRSRGRRWRKRRHQAVWITPADLRREGILLSSHMMIDHFPDIVADVLQRMVQPAVGVA